MKMQPNHYLYTKPLQYSCDLCLFALLLFSFVSCKKQYDPTKAQLPAATQEGKNTIGFTVDGAVWVPYANCGAFRNPCEEILTRYGETGGAALDGIDWGFTRFNKESSISSHLTISSTGIGTITSPGEKLDSIIINFRTENSQGNSGSYSGGRVGSSFFITKFDKQSQVISGEFEFILGENSGSGKTITLKSGRFDFRFNACKCSN